MRFPKTCDTNLNLVQGLVNKTLQAISSFLSGAKPEFPHSSCIGVSGARIRPCSGFEATSAEVRWVRQEGH